MDSDHCAPASPTGLSSAAPMEPATPSPPKASIPSADAWRTDSPPFGKRPIWQYVWLQGYCAHSDELWPRQGWGTAGIRTNDAVDGVLGYRLTDIERICKDNDIDLWSVRLVGWLPMAPPALLDPLTRPSLGRCDDGEWSASGIVAATAGETVGLDERSEQSPAPSGETPNPSTPGA